MDSTAARNRAFAEDRYARYVAGDLDAVLGSLAEDAVWESECTVRLFLRASGREEMFRKVDTLRIQGGRILEFREYYDTARARAALDGR